MFRYPFPLREPNVIHLDDETLNFQSDRNIIYVDDDEDELEEFFNPAEEDEDDELNDDEDHERLPTPQETAQLEGSSTMVPADYQVCNSATTVHGTLVQAGSTVELLNGDFLDVKYVLRDVSLVSYKVMGILLRRTRRLHKYLARRRNELCAVLQDVRDVQDPALDSCLVSYPIEDVLQHREIIFTNQPFPLQSFRMTGVVYKSFEAIEDLAPLVCRFKYIEYCSRAKNKVVSGAVMQLRESESDPGRGMSDVLKKLRYRQEPPVSEASIPSVSPPSRSTLSLPVHSARFDKKRKSRTTIDLTSDSEEERVKEIGQTYSFVRTPHELSRERVGITAKSSPFRRPVLAISRPEQAAYTYGDICAGAGGMARGADEAGLRLKFMLDHDEAACKTLRRNWSHKDARILQTDIFTFCTTNRFAKGYVVDILHVSFPCQTYSAAYTVVGKNHAANQAAGYAILNLLSRCKPRVVTFEQTSGLLERHPASFSAMINQITASGYNVRWKIWKCSELGNAQARKRLFVIASCPGEPLPPFPKATNGHGPGLESFVTIAQRLDLMPQIVEPHMQAFTEKRRQLYDPNQPLRNAITCSGGEDDLHPNGNRSFNMQELALLAGFPSNHKFANEGKTQLRRQIGNAVPSVVARKIFSEVVHSMEAEDRVVAAYQPETIMLD